MGSRLGGAGEQESRGSTQRNSRRCLRQRIAAVRQGSGRASEGCREVVMGRDYGEGEQVSPDGKRLRRWSRRAPVSLCAA